MTDWFRAYKVLTANTLAFAVCFAVWMLNGVLVTFLVSNSVYQWDKAQMGWLIGIPVLTGSLTRLPLGMLTDRYGGRPVFTLLILAAAVPTFLLGYADTYAQFFLASLGFGLTGASFAVGIAYTSLWFPKERQGLALGIFGAGNAGAALTALGAPALLALLTQHGANLDGWRMLPRLYAGGLVVTAVLFFLSTHSKKVDASQIGELLQQLRPLKYSRVWRFGLYYFLVFGGFVALAQWLVPYYVNVYAMSLAMAGTITATFSLPSGVIRGLGGWMSDRWGARAVMYWALGSCVVFFLLLIVPRMDIQSPGEGAMAWRPGAVTAVSPTEIMVGGDRYALRPKRESTGGLDREDPGHMVLPTFSSWQAPVVQVGEDVKQGQLLARGVTHIYFQANVWVFTGLVFLAGIMMGIGKAAVYKHIPDYFPEEVGVVGGMVGVLGGLGGFVLPVIFGYLLKWFGIWTTPWMLLALVSLVALVWMHLVIQRMTQARAPSLRRQIEDAPSPGDEGPKAGGRTPGMNVSA